eukprot:CAMPEP_0202730676 /NCGR_PEP_ID=MMETSP1385-20130828/186761_1 /ASSEMBLY_ACC=CAM_ASM_000861 /TAXON_ID=933848 /ORGANISM="Elphidium margaritaceum" /LENGTH=188 /DNA_ID=CAMNT_0049396955 /DNA_START=514 /DNA_END=1080 /DNA_ORIENTATION=+
MAFGEYIDRWSLCNHLTSISLILCLVPYVNNFYAMLSVFSFGMTLGEGEDIMRWSRYRLTQLHRRHWKVTQKVNDIWLAYYVPWIAGVVGITCSFTIEVWSASGNAKMAHRVKRISLISLLLSIAMSYGNRSYLETGYYLRYKNGRDLFEKLSQFVVEAEIAIKKWNKRRRRRRQQQPELRQRIAISA